MSSVDKTKAGFRLLRETIEDLERRGKNTHSAGVKPQMQRRSDFDEHRLGFSNFAEFIAAAELAGWVVRKRDGGGHTVLHLPDDAPGSQRPEPVVPPTIPGGIRRLRSDLWKAFVEWREDLIRLYDRDRSRALILSSDSLGDPPELRSVREAVRSGSDRVVPITPIGMDEQRTWMQTFAKSHAEHALGEALRRALESPRAFQAFSRILEADPELQERFREWRLGNVAAAILSWMAENDLSFSPWEEAVRPVVSPAAGDPERERLRALIHPAIDQMSTDELMRLSLPLRYVLKPSR
jgi:hypothetical protein